MTSRPILCNYRQHEEREAIARLVWPDGRFIPAVACAACLAGAVHSSIDGSHGERHPVLVSPLYGAEVPRRQDQRAALLAQRMTGGPAS